MNTLMTGIIIAAVSIVFVNVALFGFFKVSLENISLGNLLLIQAVIALFVLFLYLITKRGR